MPESIETLPLRMPAVFFGHGNPMNALQENLYTESWRKLGASIPTPKAILAISAHWMTTGIAVTAMPRPKTIHDFGGFPQALFDVRYPAPGDPVLAARVRDLLAPADVRMDQEWGLDHGVWSVLVKAFPEADIPVVQLSMDASQPAAWHYQVGRKLAALRHEGVLIIGSGNVVHNLRSMVWTAGAPAYDWATRFNDQVRHILTGSDVERLIDFAQWGPDARLAVPSDEHFLPLLYIAGTRQDDEAVSIAIDGIDAGSISMLSAVVGEVAGL
jgi:4,5-DOPA dioxygenase extradiol